MVKAGVGGGGGGGEEVYKLGSKMHRNTESEMEKAPASRDRRGRSIKACTARAMYHSHRPDTPILLGLQFAQLFF